MAENKKSFIAYCDWQETFEELSDEEAGKLVKHLFNYVNDKNPEASDKLTKMCFIPIKQSLKRDLKKYENYIEKQKINGSKGGRPKKAKETEKTQAFLEKPKKADSVSVSGNVNDNNILLSEIKISDVPDDELDYYKIAIAFQNLFIKNLNEVNAPIKSQEKAKYKNYVTPIRLLIEKDKVTKDQLKKVFKYLESSDGDFWKKNILSTQKLRKQIEKLLLQANKNNNINLINYDTEKIREQYPNI